MALRKSLNLLPAIFQTDANQKFLSATIDQLISEPNLVTVNGYIGRTFAPTYKLNDSYVTEPDENRQNYQLEPSVLVQDAQNKVTFFANYVDLLNKIEYYGGIVNDHSRLFDQEYYSFDPSISYDKFVNFGQYYWLPNGPDVVEVNTSGVELTKDFVVTRDPVNGRYNFSAGGIVNNTILLARGGTYTFTVNQPGVPFWIQSELGLDGRLNATATISTREVLGVDNNGIDVGTVTFNVPQKEAQFRFVEMNTVALVDYGTPLAYSDLHNNLLSVFLNNYPEYAGITGQLNGKTTVFVDQNLLTNRGEAAWTASATVDIDGNVISTDGAGEIVPPSDRYGVWQILFVDSGISGDPIVRLTPIQQVSINEKVFIRYGVQNAGLEFYRDIDGFFKRMPVLTSILDELFFQDGSSAGIYGKFKIVDANDLTIDVDDDILGQETYTSPNGIKFTSGLKIQFDSDVLPEKYQNKQYYVENVGDSIRLVDVSWLVTPEAYNDELALNFPDEIFPEYITIKRDSLDVNAWARNNRWFHIDVLLATASYNNVQPNLDQRLRAQRPIVQFEGDYQLYNNGRIGKQPIDILDNTSDDPFNDYEGKVISLAFGIELTDGLRVLFTNATDPLVRDKIYVLNLVQYDADAVTGVPEGDFYVKLTVAEDGDNEIFDTVVVTRGLFKGTSWWYNGFGWTRAQEKIHLQQDPLFDVVDVDGKSLSKYTGSNFEGTKLFGYLRGTSTIVDPVLNFALQYRNFGTQGDIEFKNYFDTDTFSYTEEQTSINDAKISETGFLQKIISRELSAQRNVWRTVVEDSKQYQIISYLYDRGNNPVELDINPTDAAKIPSIKVFKNNVFLTTDQYQIVDNELTLLTELELNDKIDVLVYSKNQSSNLGFYEIPNNLNLNAQNIDIDTLTLGQVRNHLISLNQNSTEVVGNILGSSNLRDVEIKQQGGSILQHSAPVPYATLFLLDETANFINSVRLAQLEYSKFKNKFLELSATLQGIQPTDPATSVDLILTNINAIKNTSFPWFYSDMVPYGTLRTVVRYTVFNALVRSYEISNVFDDQKISNQAVLVYLNNVQLIKDIDYFFEADRPALTINESVELRTDDNIVIYEFPNTDGNYIPETPTKLGLYPKFVPQIFLDNSYRTPINVIQGHDGSITPTFGDYRDDFLLELEKRIYNNIKLPASQSVDEYYAVMPGRFRENDYSITEAKQLLSKGFQSWVGNNRLEFATNNTFQSNDAFTWNYANFADKLDESLLPGSWRACYLYYYDTVRPHLTPWEMLGFSVKPDWWEDYYGPAPYTGGNKLLWEDLEAGRIVDGDRAGIDPKFARPGLTRIIPVDANGFLLPPLNALAKSATGSKSAASAWSVGDIGPTEWAWRTSSDFPFAVQQALALSKPARYFGLLFDTFSYRYNADLNQYLTAVNKHLTQNLVKFNGQSIDGTITRTAGYINWIADYLTNQGINPNAKLIPLISNYQVNLAYKAAGFTDKRYIRVLAEQSSPTSTNDSIVVPDENYEVYLHKSTPVQRLVYSAVIVEKTTNGYSIRGYDLNNPYFTIIPSVVNSNSYRIQVLEREGVIYRDYQTLKITVPYGYEFSTQQQIVDFLISYERYLISQGFTFNDRDAVLNEGRNFKLSVKEFLFWAQQGWKTGSILVLSPIADTISAVSELAITDGITDSQYGSKVLDQNFRMVKNNNYNIVRDANNFKITLTDEASVIGYIELNLVQYEHVLIFDNSTVFNDVIYKPELGNRQFRLKLIGQKTAEWDGSLYAPGFIYNSETVAVWQSGKDYLRGELVQFKNQYYVALQNAIGSTEFNFANWRQINRSEIKSGLLPNFSTTAVKSQSSYDSYGYFRDEDQLSYSHGLIGFKPRQYLTDLGLNETTQIELYKGYIKQKGSRNAVDALTQAEFNNLSSQINYYEEWAIRVGEYGALDTNPYVEVVLDEQAFGVNPGIARFLSPNSNETADGITLFNKSQLYKSTDTYDGSIALIRDNSSNYDNDIPTAGYVNIDDVDATLFDLNDYATLNGAVPNITLGYKIWVALDFTKDWNVFRVCETNNKVVEISNNLDGTITITTKIPHNLTINDILVVKGFDPQFDGFYKVSDSNSITTLVADFNGSRDVYENLITLEGDGILFKLDSMRFLFIEDARIYGLANPLQGWKEGDKIWIDLDAPTSFVQGQPVETGNNLWKVYEKQFPWSYNQRLDKVTNYVANDGYGTSVRLSADASIAVAGSPYSAGFGNVVVFDRTDEDQFAFNQTITPNTVGALEFGYDVDLAAQTRLGVGAPKSGSSRGHVYIYDRVESANSFSISQVIAGPNASGRFGHSISFDETGYWLYVGAPDIDKVFAYGLNRNVTANTSTITISTTTNSMPLSSLGNIISASSVTIGSSTRTYIPVIDYTVFTSNNTAQLNSGNWPQTTYTIEQKPYYELMAVLTSPQGSGKEFGAALDSSLDGAQLGVGTPNANVLVNGTWVQGAGAVYVYDRVIEAFNTVSDAATGTNGLEYEVSGNIGTVYRVLVDNTEVPFDEYTVNRTVSPNRIVFGNAQPVGSILYVETNEFNLLETLIGIDSLEGGTGAIQENARFGTALTICSNNCAIYVGAPNYDNGAVYNTGAVWKFHNKGRLYGTNTAYSSNPIFTLGESIRLDNFEVEVSGRLAPITVNSTEGNILALSGNITANAGSFITQSSSGANVTVLASVVSSNTVSVLYNNSNTFTFGSGNITVAGTPVAVYPVIGLDSFVYDINSANILGVSAVNQNDRLRFNTDRTLAKNLLRILSGQGNVLEDAGIVVFAFMQIIVPPFNNAGEQFGKKVILAKNAYQLVISSDVGTTRRYTTFDSYSNLRYPNAPFYVEIAGETVVNPDQYLLDTRSNRLVNPTRFDGGATGLFDSIPNSGSVYIYELYDDPRDAVEHPGRYAFAQQLNVEDLDAADPNDELNVADKFGAAIDVVGGYILVSAPGDDTSTTDAGSIYLFRNPQERRGWNLIRYQEPEVDVESVNKIFLYSNTTNTILNSLEFIDPAKGKILGAAEQEITFKTEYDPAHYNRGNGTRGTVNENLFWATNQIGQVWWDLSLVRYIKYEQDTVGYRRINWGSTFPGSQIEVCEWVESTVLPSQYVDNGGNGEPKYADNSAYVQTIFVDPVTNIITSRYYYWVKNKTSLDPNNPTRKIPLSVISSLIGNPKAQGVSYAALIRPDTVILYNISRYLSGQTTVLHIDHELSKNDSIIHSEYELLQLGNPDSFVPNKIINKLIDSLAGKDALGNSVPDPNLSTADQIGISIRPRQSMFVDRRSAISLMVDYVNDILIKKPTVRQYDISQLLDEEQPPHPSLNEYNKIINSFVELSYLDVVNLPTGYLVLVEIDSNYNNLWTIYELQSDLTWELVRKQAYKTSDYWDYVDWYAEGYDSTEQIEFLADTYVDALTLPVSPGDEVLVRVTNSVGGGWNLLTKKESGEFEVVAIERGTLQLKSNLSQLLDLADTNEQDTYKIVKNIILALTNKIFIDDIQAETNKLFFVLVNYIFNEQKYVDWIFKTSFISVTHRLRTLEQFPSYIRDNQTYYEDYINEVKPYVTKIREYLIGYDSNDEVQGSLTDFDLPAYYDSDLRIFRSPSGELSAKDQQLWATGFIGTTLINQEYPTWYANRFNKIASIIITNPGRGYTSEPTIIIEGAVEGEVNATAAARIDFDTGELIAIDLLTSGGGYLTTPRVTINGGNLEPATAYAVLENKQVRSINTTIKFDRTTYTSNVREWQPNTTYTQTVFQTVNGIEYWLSGDIVTHAILEGDVYIRQAYKVLATFTSGATFVAEQFELVDADQFTNANDRILAYYQPFTDMPARDLRQLIYGIGYPGVQIQGLTYETSSAFGAKASANITFNSTLPNGIKIGDTITQPEADILLNFDYAISANIGDFITQPSTGANVTVYGDAINDGQISSVVDSKQVYAIKNNSIEFLAAGNISLNGNTIINSAYNVEDEVWSNTAVSLVTTTVGTATLVAVPIPDASITITEIWSNIKVQGEFNSTTDFVTSNVSIVGGNIKLNNVWANTYPVTVEYVSSSAVEFDSEGFDNTQAFADDGETAQSAIDTLIRSSYTDTQLGLRPEDINVDGGAYIDTYSSHAPEELIPGAMVETLDMKVYTQINSGSDILGYRIFNRSYSELDLYDSGKTRTVSDTTFLRLADAYSTKLTVPLALTDEFIYVEDAGKLPAPNIFLAVPGVIFVNGERIVYYTVDLLNNTLGQLRRGTLGTPIYNVQPAGSLAVDGSVGQIIPNTAIVTANISTQQTLTVTGTPAYQLRLNTNLQANVGDVITQLTSGANATVIGTDLSTDLLLINYNNSTQFDFANVAILMSGNITANAGSYLTQTSSGANLLVVDSTTGANILAQYTTSTVLDIIGNVEIDGETANVRPVTVGVSPNISANLLINGTATSNIQLFSAPVYPLVSTLTGYRANDTQIDINGVSGIDENGNVIVAANTVLNSSNVWVVGNVVANVSAGIFEIDTASIQVNFLKEETANDILRTIIPDIMTTEDTLNILITEDGKQILEE